MTVYVVTLEQGERTLPNKAIEYVLSQEDWLRLMNGTMYFVATDQAINDLLDRIRNVVPDDHSILISALAKDIKLSGFLPDEAWEWLRKYIPNLVYGDEWQVQRSKKALKGDAPDEH